MKPTIRVRIQKPVPEILALQLPERAADYLLHFQTVLLLRERYPVWLN